MKSWKIGAISGLIAGIAAGIVYSIILVGMDSIGLPHPFELEPFLIQFTSTIEMFATEIILATIWGVILGAIYSWFFDLIPGKKVSKGLLFGLIYYLIYNFRGGMLALYYGFVFTAFSGFLSGLFTWIVYGLVLSISYEFMSSRYYIPKDRKPIRTYPVMSGIFPGAFAGCVYGIVAFFDNLLMGLLGIWAWIPNYLADIEFLIYQLGTHVFFNLIWGTVFGMLFVFLSAALSLFLLFSHAFLFPFFADILNPFYSIVACLALSSSSVFCSRYISSTTSPSRKIIQLFSNMLPSGVKDSFSPIICLVK